MVTQSKITLDIDIIEEPGTGFPVGQCPYCSRGYPELNAEGIANEIPSRCRRCGAPMDWDEVHKQGGYADKQAEIFVSGPPKRTRDRMVKEPARSKGQD